VCPFGEPIPARDFCDARESIWIFRPPRTLPNNGDRHDSASRPHDPAGGRVVDCPRRRRSGCRFLLTVDFPLRDWGRPRHGRGCRRKRALLADADPDWSKAQRVSRPPYQISDETGPHPPGPDAPNWLQFLINEPPRTASASLRRCIGTDSGRVFSFEAAPSLSLLSARPPGATACNASPISIFLPPNRHGAWDPLGPAPLEIPPKVRQPSARAPPLVPNGMNRRWERGRKTTSRLLRAGGAHACRWMLAPPRPSSLGERHAGWRAGNGAPWTYRPRRWRSPAPLPGRAVWRLPGVRPGDRRCLLCGKPGGFLEIFLPAAPWLGIIVVRIKQPPFLARAPQVQHVLAKIPGRGPLTLERTPYSAS